MKSKLKNNPNDKIQNKGTSNTELQEITLDLQRTRADFENFRKQSEFQKAQYGTVVKFTTVSKILPLLDDIDRAIAAHPKELEPIVKNLQKTLNELNLIKIDSKPKTPFNPDLHEAVAVEGEGENEIVSETLRAGYKYENEVLRPAIVKVQKVD